MTAGNGYGGGERPLTTTEILVEGSSEWTVLSSVSNFPHWTIGPASVSFNNNIFVLGNQWRNDSANVFLFDFVSETWIQTGSLPVFRRYLAASLVDADLAQQCLD